MLGSSTMIGPGRSLSRHCSTIRSDYSISRMACVHPDLPNPSGGHLRGQSSDESVWAAPGVPWRLQSLD
jgi:hypothetical protein